MKSRQKNHSSEKNFLKVLIFFALTLYLHFQYAVFLRCDCCSQFGHSLYYTNQRIALSQKVNKLCRANVGVREIESS